MLTESEKIAVRYVLGEGALPTHEKIDFIDIVATSDAKHKVKLVDLRDDIDELVGALEDRLTEEKETGYIIQDASDGLEKLARALVYKIMDNPDKNITETLEFKDIKSELGIY